MQWINKWYGLITVSSFWVVIAFHFVQIWETWNSGQNVFNPAFAFLLLATSTSFYSWGLAKGDVYMAVSRVPSSITAAFSLLQYWSPRFSFCEFIAVLGANCLFFFSLFLFKRKKSPQTEKMMFYIGRTFFALGYSIGLILQAKSFLEHGAEGATLEYWSALLISSALWTIYGLMKKDWWQIIFFGLGTILTVPIVIEIVEL